MIKYIHYILKEDFKLFGFIKGIIAYKNGNTIIIDNSGIGFEVLVSSLCFKNIGEIGEEVTLWIHTHVREDEISLIGFIDLQEREVFRKLISVNGVGPKMALTILGGISAQDLTVAIATGQSTFLKGIKGVGAKIRERIMLELKEKMQTTDFAMSETAITNNNLFETAVSVLVDWGVQKSVAQQIIQNNLTADDNLETLLAKAFKDMGK